MVAAESLLHNFPHQIRIGLALFLARIDSLR